VKGHPLWAALCSCVRGKCCSIALECRKEGRRRSGRDILMALPGC
jgi:hypothetical protein